MNTKNISDQSLIDEAKQGAEFARFLSTSKLNEVKMPTHTVFNQASPLVDYNMFSTDAVLMELVQTAGANWAESLLADFGRIAGSAEAQARAVQANRNEPVLHNFDRTGNRVDQVEFHPAYHDLMRTAVEHRVHCLPWQEPREGAHVARAVMMFMAYQYEAGHCCPISMTYSAVPALRKQPDVAADWVPLICTDKYDPRFAAPKTKSGLLLGMGMTEKQGGSDVRANTTRAVPAGQPGPGREYLLTGHKWFCSAPMSDAWLVLAHAKAGISCFLVPRFKPDGTPNNIVFQRLKDKLGNRSNASSEVEYDNAVGILIGEEGRGVPTIIEMVNHTRLDCTIGSAALLRQASAQALHHCGERSAFGKKLADQPLMRNVLADLAVEAEAATRLMMRVAQSYDAQHTSEQEARFKRIASAVAKFWVCKRAPLFVSEALECLGGNGYVEESVMPRLFRESPLNSIWEGAGNVICLDVMRAATREAGTADALLCEIRKAEGADRHLDALIRAVVRDIRSLRKAATGKGLSGDELEFGARQMVERFALALQGSLMVQDAPQAVADAWISSRVARRSGLILGSLPAATNVEAIIERARVAK